MKQKKEDLARLGDQQFVNRELARLLISPESPEFKASDIDSYEINILNAGIDWLLAERGVGIDEALGIDILMALVAAWRVGFNTGSRAENGSPADMAAQAMLRLREAWTNRLC